MAPAGGNPQTGAREVAIEIVRTLRDAGHTAYFAGGCVRDELLGLTPSDYDVATDATPEKVSRLFRRTAHVGAHFGVVLVKGTLGPRNEGSDAVVEVATFRSDGSYSDRRRPDSVTFSDARADAQRRDFTVNAMFLDPLAAPTAGQGAGPRGALGQVVDYVGGLADLEARLLRAVGDPEARLAEDHLRALRAVRLSARLGFAVEAATEGAIARHARDLDGVSRERIGEEMRRILCHPSRATGVGLLQRLGLDLPVLGNAKPAAALARLGGVPDRSSLGVCLAALALDRGDVESPPGIQGVLSRWRRTLCLSNEEREAARDAMASYFFVLQEFMTSRVARQKRAAVAAGFEGAMAILRVTDGGIAEVVERRTQELAATGSGIGPTPLVTGDDLIGVGMRPGPGFASLLARLYDAQLEDMFGTREDGLRLAAELASGVGGAGDR